MGSGKILVGLQQFLEFLHGVLEAPLLSLDVGTWRESGQPPLETIRAPAPV